METGSFKLVTCLGAWLELIIISRWGMGTMFGLSSQANSQHCRDSNSIIPSKVYTTRFKERFIHIASL